MQTPLAASLSFIPSVFTALSLLGPNGPGPVALSAFFFFFLHLMHPRLSGGWRMKVPTKKIFLKIHKHSLFEVTRHVFFF